MAYLNEKIPVIHNKALDNIKKAQSYQKKFYDKKSKLKRDYKIGDLIARKNLDKIGGFPKERWSGPWVILSENNDDRTSFKIARNNGTSNHVSTANVKHMRIWHPALNSGSTSRSSS